MATAGSRELPDFLAGRRPRTGPYIHNAHISEYSIMASLGPKFPPNELPLNTRTLYPLVLYSVRKPVALC